MLTLFNDEIFSSPLAESAYFDCNKARRLKVRGILESVALDEHLGHAVTLDANRVTFYTYPDVADKVKRGTLCTIERQNYEVIDTSIIDDMSVISLCPH